MDKINSQLSEFEDLEQTFDNKSLLWDFIKCIKQFHMQLSEQRGIDNENLNCRKNYMRLKK